MPPGCSWGDIRPPGSSVAGDFAASARRSSSGDDCEPARACEVTEISVAGDECDAVVEAALGDEGVGEASAAVAREHLRTQRRGALPIAV